MSCPNCHQPFKELVDNNQKILHCPNCGTTFFEANGINRVSSEVAFQLATDKQTDEVSAEEKNCPKDGLVMTPISNSQALPPGVTLLQCSACHGILAYPDDLVNFKKAQDAKVDFFHAWKIPLSSITAVMVLSFFGIISLSVFTKLFFLDQSSFTATRADETVKSLLVTRSSRYLFLSFKTATPVMSKIIFTNRDTGETKTLLVSSVPKTIHSITTTELNLNNRYSCQIVIYDNQGNEVKSKAVLLSY